MIDGFTFDFENQYNITASVVTKHLPISRLHVIAKNYIYKSGVPAKSTCRKYPAHAGVQVATCIVGGFI